MNSINCVIVQLWTFTKLFTFTLRCDDMSAFQVVLLIFIACHHHSMCHLMSGAMCHLPCHAMCHLPRYHYADLSFQLIVESSVSTNHISLPISVSNSFDMEEGMEFVGFSTISIVISKGSKAWSLCYLL